MWTEMLYKHFTAEHSIDHVIVQRGGGETSQEDTDRLSPPEQLMIHLDPNLINNNVTIITIDHLWAYKTMSRDEGLC